MNPTRLASVARARLIRALADGVQTGETAALFSAAIEVSQARDRLADAAIEPLRQGDLTDPAAWAATAAALLQTSAEAHLSVVRLLLWLVPIAFLIGVAVGCFLS